MAPLPSLLLLAHIIPPWASIILFDIYNPSPVPEEYFSLANFVNNTGKIAGSIPVPVSFTDMLIHHNMYGVSV